MNVGKFLKHVREERKLSLRQVAKALNVGTSSINEYENNLSDPPTSKFMRLCDFYNVRLFMNEDNSEVIDYSQFTNESKEKIRAIEKHERELMNKK